MDNHGGSGLSTLLIRKQRQLINLMAFQYNLILLPPPYVECRSSWDTEFQNATLDVVMQIRHVSDGPSRIVDVRNETTRIADITRQPDLGAYAQCSLINYSTNPGVLRMPSTSLSPVQVKIKKTWREITEPDVRIGRHKAVGTRTSTRSPMNGVTGRCTRLLLRCRPVLSCVSRSWSRSVDLKTEKILDLDRTRPTGGITKHEAVCRPLTAIRCGQTYTRDFSPSHGANYVRRCPQKGRGEDITRVRPPPGLCKNNFARG